LPGQLAHADLAPEAWGFLDALHKHGWLSPFDWTAWQDEAERYLKDPAALASADLDTLRKLLTLHVRKDRFCDGHLLEMFESGNITAILRRLKVLAETRTESR
jgi:hypothetical protein